MGFTNSRATFKWRDPHTKNLKYCSSAKFGEHNNKFDKWCPPTFSLMNVENIYSPPMIKIDIFDHPFIKYDIFEATLNFPPKGNPVDIVTQYYDNHNLSYIYQSNNNRPWNKTFPARNRTNVWILIIVIKETTTLQQATETIQSH